MGDIITGWGMGGGKETSRKKMNVEWKMGLTEATFKAARVYPTSTTAIR